MKRPTFVTFCVVLAFHALALLCFRMGTAVAPLPVQVVSFQLVADSYLAPQKIPEPELRKANPPRQEPTSLPELSKPEVRPALPESTPALVDPVITKKPSANFQSIPSSRVPSKTPSAVARGKPSRAQSTTPVKGSAVSVRPSYRSHPNPPYPAESRRLRQEGQALLTVQISAQGRVENVVLRKSSGFPLLDQSAMKTVRRWTFYPAILNGVAVASEIEVPIRFRGVR